MATPEEDLVERIGCRSAAIDAGDPVAPLPATAERIVRDILHGRYAVCRNRRQPLAIALALAPAVVPKALMLGLVIAVLLL